MLFRLRRDGDVASIGVAWAASTETGMLVSV